MQVVSGEGVRPALRRVLAGEGCVAVIPEKGAEPYLRMLRPEVPVEHDECALIVATSGATGDPKGVMLSVDAVRFMVEATHRRLGGPGRWDCALPVHHIAGLMTIARDLVAVEAAGSAEMPKYTSMVPAQLHQAFQNPAESAKLRQFQAILLGGSAIPAGMLEAAAAAGLNVVTTYGMSETCGGCVYNRLPLDGVTIGFEKDVAVSTASPEGESRGTHWPSSAILPAATSSPQPRTPPPSSSTNVGDPVSDVPEALGANQGRASVASTITLSGPMAFLGYRLAPELTAAVLTGQTVRTRDLGYVADGLLYVTGRMDDVVISGGENVDLHAAQQAADRLFGIDAATRVVLVDVPDPRFGVRIVAVTANVLPDAQIVNPLAEVLERPAVPKQIHRLDALPLTALGKLSRDKIRELIDAGASPRK
jgi:O-succinylbenzoic acid--CoA ligase